MPICNACLCGVIVVSTRLKPTYQTLTVSGRLFVHNDPHWVVQTAHKVNFKTWRSPRSLQFTVHNASATA